MQDNYEVCVASYTDYQKLEQRIKLLEERNRIMVQAITKLYLRVGLGDKLP